MQIGSDLEQAVREELSRVLSSPEFARSERISRLLQFLVDRQLNGRETELKESTIGVELFGRKPDYDPKQDSTVRTEASRLRARLARYYAGEGSRDPLVIEIPKGGYVPAFGSPDRVVESGRPAKPVRVTLALAGLALLATVIAATLWWGAQHKSETIPIAVLPLINLSQDASNDYFADGLTSEIIRNLSILDGLAVRSQTSSFAFKGKPRNLGEVGKLLRVDYLLEGSVLRAGRQLRINAQLVRVRDDLPVWSGRYDREVTDLFAIQDEISRGIVNRLRVKLGRGQRRYETSIEAYDFYLRARSFEMLPGLSGLDRSIEPFEQAVTKDPLFAPAYAGLGAAHAARSGFDDPVDRAAEVSKGWAAAQKAVQLDPLLAEAHNALGMMRAREAQWEQAELSFRRALELAPGEPRWHYDFALFLLVPLARIEEGLRHLRIAEELDPLSPAVHYSLRLGLRAAGRSGEADSHCLKAAVNDQQKSRCAAEVLIRQGKIDEGLRSLEAAWKGQLLEPGASELGVEYAKAGRREDAERVAAVVPRPFEKAAIFAALGDKDRTFEALDRGVPLGPTRMGRVLVAPGFELLSGDPRLRALRKKAGLP